jgi:transcriptional regulator with XRE-family HTH domain
MRRQRLPAQDDSLLALGRAVREVRARSGLSQESVGMRADMHRNYVGSIERGEANVGFLNLLRVVGALDVPFAEFAEVWERQLRTRPNLRKVDEAQRPARGAHSPTRLISSRADRPYATTIPPWPAIRSTASARTSAASAPNAASRRSR